MSDVAEQQRRSDQVGSDHHDPLFGHCGVDSWRMFVGRHAFTNLLDIGPNSEWMQEVGFIGQETQDFRSITL